MVINLDQGAPPPTSSAGPADDVRFTGAGPLAESAGATQNGHRVSGDAAMIKQPTSEAVGITIAGTQVQANNPSPLQSGRTYHEEHFNHGILLPNDVVGNSGVIPGDTDVYVKQQSRMPTGRQFDGVDGKEGSAPLQHQYTTVGGAPMAAVNFGTPMPKWPAGHQSAAFDAVGQKKSLILSPAEIFAECAHHGEEKSKFPWYKIWILSIIAGCYVGFGYSTCLLVGGNLNFAPAVVNAHGSGEVNVGLFKLIYGAFGFPFGFTTIVVCGAELYTSLCAYMTAAWWEGKVGVPAVIRMLAISWTGNFIGCALMAGLLKASMIYDHYDYTLKAIARDKVSHPWGATFVKGIFANWLVGIATWMANAAQDLTGKFVGIWLPISAFAALGFEHSIANMFLYVMAWAQGESITAKEFIWNNLIPSTLGNYVGGGVCLATVYAFAFGRTPKRMGAYYDDKVAPKMPWSKKRD